MNKKQGKLQKLKEADQEKKITYRINRFQQAVQYRLEYMQDKPPCCMK